jgi:ribulose bisphosphate carboxylase small subunit
MFETFSYLPPLSDDQIARQVDYIVNNSWTPCLEFSEPELAYVQSTSTSRMGNVSSVSTKQFSSIVDIAICSDQAQLCGSSQLAVLSGYDANAHLTSALHLPCCLQNYFDNRYWTLWKLPMFGCTDPVQVRHTGQICSPICTAIGSKLRFAAFTHIPLAVAAITKRSGSISAWRSRALTAALSVTLQQQ